MRVAMKSSSFEIPDADNVPHDFLSLLQVGKNTWEIEAFGFNWKFTTLENWEISEIERKLSGYDNITKVTLMRLEYLEKSIISADNIKAGIKYDFVDLEDKAVLRNILLSLDDKVIGLLYDCYIFGARKERAKFNDLYEKVRDKLAKDFFVSAGKYSSDSDLKIQETEDSVKS